MMRAINATYHAGFLCTWRLERFRVVEHLIAPHILGSMACNMNELMLLFLNSNIKYWDMIVF
jgi:hypothetical protein